MSTFDQAKFESHRALAERLKPKQQVYVLARELLMLCDEIARLQLLVKPVSEEQLFWDTCKCGAKFHLKDSPTGFCPDCRDRPQDT